MKRMWHFLKTALGKALPAAVATGWPGQELQIYGITGTDGKTTSSTLLYHILKENGYKVALVSTVAAYIGDEEIDTGFHTTSPQPDVLYRLLRRIADEGVEHVVLEVTAHGIWQYRVWGIPFAMAGVTNVTQEHLDYFYTWEKYVQVKGELLAKAKHAFLNASDASYPLLQEQLARSNTRYGTYTQQLPADKELASALAERFREPYNQWNAHLVWKMCETLGMSPAGFSEAIRTFPGVPGRLEQVAAKPCPVIVDFAHTPNAVEQALQSLRQQTKGRLIAVYGSAGERDRAKRPVMGKAGACLADLAVFTAEDPRTEQVEVIIRQMKEGVLPKHLPKVVSIPDRREAIAWALKEAHSDDTIAVLGKGHEQSMCFGHTETPWSDRKVILEPIEERRHANTTG